MWDPENTRRWANAGLLLTHRLRRRANIKPALAQRLLLAGDAWETEPTTPSGISGMSLLT